MTFSLGEGIIHEYYTVALAPALGALVGIGGVTLWRRRGNWFARIGLAGVIALTGWWTVQLLRRTPNFNAWLQPLVVVGSIIGVVGVLAADHIGRTGRAVALSAGVVAGLIAPDGGVDRHGGACPTPARCRRRPRRWVAASAAAASPAASRRGGNRWRLPRRQRTAARRRPAAPPPVAAAPAAGGGGGIGGILGASTPSAELTSALQQDADQYTWAAATIGANQAAGYQLASGEPVMAIGGFNGTDPWPTLEVFQQYVAEGRIHYFIGGGARWRRVVGLERDHPAGSSRTSRATTIGGTTVYDLSGGTTS